MQDTGICIHGVRTHVYTCVHMGTQNMCIDYVCTQVECAHTYMYFHECMCEYGA